MNLQLALDAERSIDLAEWGRQRTQYSRARRGRTERGAGLAECSLMQGVTQALALRRNGPSPDPGHTRSETPTAA